jgi:hypothetical protein
LEAAECLRQEQEAAAERRQAQAAVAGIGGSGIKVKGGDSTFNPVTNKLTDYSASTNSTPSAAQ